MSFALYLRLVRRELRGSRGRLLFFMLSLAAGVAAVTAVAGLGASLERGLRGQVREILGADVIVEGRRELPEELERAFREAGAEAVTRVKEMPSMVSAREPRPDRAASVMVQLVVPDGTYPLRGALNTDTGRPLEDLLDARHCVVGAEVLDSLGLRVGDELNIRGAHFVIADVARTAPGQIDFRQLMLPRVLVPGEGMARTMGLSLGGRTKHLALLNFPATWSRDELDSRLETARGALGEEGTYLRIETWHGAQPRIERVIGQLEVFLGLVALVSLLLGGLGVSQIVRAWLAGRTEALAILRCLGLRPAEILRVYLGAVALLALVGSAVGALAGLFVPRLVPWLLDGLIPAQLVGHLEPSALFEGLGLGLGVSLFSSIPPLTALHRVSPARVLRADAEPLPASKRVRLLSALVLAGGLLAAARFQTGRLDLALGFVAALALVAGALALAAGLLLRGVRRLPRRRLHPYLVNGLAALGRPGKGTTGAIVSLGLGTMTVLGMLLLERSFDRELGSILPEDAPSLFMLGIPEDSWPAVARLLDEHGARSVNAPRVVSARLLKIAGRPVEEIVADESDPRHRARTLKRDHRLAEMAQLPPSDRRLAGGDWSPDELSVSLEQGYARRLRVGVGETLTYELGGQPVTLRITSLREARWESFELNFFTILEPGTLEETGAASYRVAVARLEPGPEARFQDAVTREAPIVTVIRVRPIAERVAALVGTAGTGIRVLGSFTVLTGLMILVGVVASSTLRRTKEVALLKTLGVLPRGVVGLFAVEFALLGAVAGALGVLGGFGAVWALLSQVLDFSLWAPAWVLLLALAGTVLLAVLCGLLGCARALRTTPLRALREG